MSQRARESLLWGVVGVLSFLVLVQGYELVAEPGIAIPAKVGVALAVGVAATGLTDGARRWLEARSP